jgi:hypothetical protein
MEFFRRLAPPRAGDTARAVAAMPSRFAVEQPLRAIEAPPADTATAVPVGARSTSMWLPLHQPEGPSAAVRSGVLHGPSIGPRTQNRTEAAPEEPALRSGDVGGPLPPSAPPPSARGLTPTTTRPEMRHQVAGRTVPAADTLRRRPQRASMPAVERAAPTASSADAPDPYQADVPRAAAPRPAAPLSTAAIEMRIAPARAPQPVIHVTIDRLEVRAPAGVERTPAPAKRRAASPTVSLADYLRRRGPGSSGGTP